MPLHNPPRIGPSTTPPTEWDANIQRMRPRTFDHTRHNQGPRVARANQLNQPVVWQARRGYLGVGSSILSPYGEYLLPKNITASNFMQRIEGVTEGERIELLPASVSVGYHAQASPPEAVYVFRRSTAKEDFVIPQGRVLRVVLTRPKAIYL